jgi:beta-1,4-mannosyl-glycoprotein beta-1,4-N-acetylglucosaminyltransferase
MLILLVAILFYTTNLYAKVYDCFLFLNELEILDIRLHEMDPVVDYFVIVEAVETFRGNPKDLVFAEHADQFKEFEHKIIYFVVDRLFETYNPWDRETYHRNMIASALPDCEDEDVILISDVDEIVEAKGVTGISQCLHENPTQILGVSQKYISKFLNAVPDPVVWRGTVALTYQQLEKTTPQQLREMRYTVPAVAEGWHFTYQGGIDRELYKISAFAHSELDTPEGREAQRKASLLRNCCPVVEIDDSFPRYIRENQAHFEKIDFIRPP